MQVIFAYSGMKSIKHRSHCPVSFALDLFGDKWTLLIIRDLMFKGKRTYGEFLQSEEKIATNILADRLQTLDHAGLIAKQQDPKNKSKFIYTLTGKGIDLLPVLVEIIRWSSLYDPKSAADKNFIHKANINRGTLIEELSASLRKESKSQRKSDIS